MSTPRKRSAAMVAALRETGGDLDAVAKRFDVSPASLYQSVRRAGLSMTTLRHGPTAATVTPVDDGPPPFMVLRTQEYLSLVAQATSAGEVWAKAERIIATLTRELEARAA